MKRILLVILALLILCTGCNLGKPTNGKETDVNEPTTDPSQYTDSKETDVNEPTTDPSQYTDKVLVWVVPNLIEINSSTLKEFNSKLLSKGCDFVVNFLYLDFENYTARLEETRASSEQMDIVFTGFDSSHDASISASIHDIRNKKYVELTQHLETESGERLYELFDEKEWRSVLVDNSIYSIPNDLPISTGDKWMFNKEYVSENDLLNFSGDLFDLEDILASIPQKDDFSPLVLSSISQISDSYIKADFISDSVLINHSDKKTYAITQSSDFIAFLKTLNRYYKNQYINYNHSLLWANDTSQERAKELIKPGNFAIALADEETSADVFTISSKPHMRSRVSASTGIAATSEYVNEALKLLSHVHADKELANILVHGILDEDYQLIDSYAYDMNGEPSFTNINELCLGLYSNIYANIESDTRSDRSTAKMNFYEEEVLASPLLGFNFDSRDYVGLMNKLDTIVNANIEKLWKSDDFDAELGELDKLLKEAGIDDLVNAVNNQLTSWNGE